MSSHLNNYIKYVWDFGGRGDKSPQYTMNTGHIAYCVTLEIENLSL